MRKILALLFCLFSSPSWAAISCTNLINNLQNSAATSYATASVSPVANALTILAVASQFAGTSNTPTATGASMTWAQIATGADATNNRRVTLFRALSASPGSGAVTIDFAGQSQSNAAWSIESCTGTDTSGTNGSGAVVQSGTATHDSGTSSTGLTVALSALGSANNATYGMVRANGGSAIVAGSGFTALSNQTTIRVHSEWKLNDANVAWTWASQLVISNAVGFEIKAATAANSGIPLTLTGCGP